MADIASSTLDALATAVATAASESLVPAEDPLAGTPGYCIEGNEYDGYFGARISAIFVILVMSLLGACFPTFAARRAGAKFPSWPFFIAKYFGSGVIIATAFIHLLSPAYDALRNPCLTGPIIEYDWVAGIALMTIFVLFFVELMAMRFAIFDPTANHAHLGVPPPQVYKDGKVSDEVDAESGAQPASPHVPGEDHLSHTRAHVDVTNPGPVGDSYSAQMTAIFILEFGVIFHSIFIGLALAVSGPDEFVILYIVLVFHQTFEGLGLGSRLALAPWPENKRWTPYLLGAGYAISTPIAIAVGIGLRSTYSPGSQTALIANGVFDSISAGILIYTGLVELLAHEFMFSENMRKKPLPVVLGAVGIMALGAGLMALLGKWA